MWQSFRDECCTHFEDCTVPDKIKRNKTAGRSRAHRRLDVLCGQFGQFLCSESEGVKHTCGQGG